MIHEPDAIVASRSGYLVVVLSSESLKHALKFEVRRPSLSLPFFYLHFVGKVGLGEYSNVGSESASGKATEPPSASAAWRKRNRHQTLRVL